MTIILDNLDKRRSYICLEVGSSAISKQIQKLTKQFAPKDSELPVPSHVFMLVYEKPYWVIYESHMTTRRSYDIPSGVRCYPAMYPFVLNVLQRSWALPMKINRATMRSHLGEPYGVRDILELAKVCITHKNGTQPDRQGLICSEYAALCYPKIMKDLNLPAHAITPAHWLGYLSSK